MKFFRSFLEPNYLALTPQLGKIFYAYLNAILGYEHYGRQSAIARKYLKWLAHRHKVHIQTIETAEGEKHFQKVNKQCFA